MINREKLRKDREEAKASATASDLFWVPSPGKHRIKLIVPPGKDIFYVKKRFHYLDVAGQRKSVMCSETDCPVCQLMSRLARNGDTAGANSLRPRLRYFATIVPLEEQPLRVRIWGFGVQIFEEIASYIEDPEWGDAVLKNDLILEREGEGLNTEYRVRVSQKSTPIPKAVLADMPDLDEILVPRERDYITSLLSDTEYGDLLSEFPDESGYPQCFGMFDKTDQSCRSCKVNRQCMKQTLSADDTAFGTPVTKKKPKGQI